MELDADKLFLEINSGKTLEPEMVASIASYLEEIDFDDLACIDLDNVYGLLGVLGKLHAYDYRYLFTKFLKLQDPMTAVLILETLCLEWNQTEEQFEHLVHFALGASWDGDDDVRLATLKIMGEYVRGLREEGEISETKANQVRRVMELLLRNFDDTNNDPWTRQAAYIALGRSQLREHAELPGECSTPNFDPESEKFEQAILDESRQFISALSSSSPSSSSVSTLSPATR